MGAACCGANTYYPEIDEISSLSELCSFLQEKQEFVQKQSEEIKDYITDKSKIPKSIEVATIEEKHLGKRMKYLNDYNKALGEARDIIAADSKINIVKAKDVVHRLWDYFFVEFDDTNEHSKVIDELKAITKEKQ